MVQLGCEQPLDLESTLFSGQAFRWRHVAGCYQGIVFQNVVTLRPTSGGVEFATRPDSAACIAPRLADYLTLDTDLQRIYDSLAADSRLAAAGARFLGDASPWHSRWTPTSRSGSASGIPPVHG